MSLFKSNKKRKKKLKDPVTPRVALLQALIEGEGYGLELAERVKERTGGALEIGQGSLYPALWDLERDGLVTSRETEPLPERGGRPRKYYHLTAEGLRRAREEKEVMGRLLQLVGEGV
jgi:PadR family transcriptional regulator, regulatory protein PadR